MRRAIQVATGNDPARDFEKCPVHVVVLASLIGPAPYELEDTYPANVSSGGVKHFRPEHYARARPVLAERMAEYLAKHGHCYDRVTTFTEGRYAEVMADARELAGIDFPILPQKGGPIVELMGKSKPRTYWAKYWIQLYLEIVDWLGENKAREARSRLEKLEVSFRDRE
jgi:predicted RNA-binding protein